MKRSSKAAATMLAVAVAAQFGLSADTAQAADAVRVQLNGVPIYSPYNYILQGTTYVDLEGYAQLTNQTYALSSDKTAATLRGKTFPIRLVDGVPTAPLRQIAEAGGAEDIYFDNAANLTYVLDLPDGAARIGTGDIGEDRWAAGGGTHRPVYGVIDRRLAYLEYAVPAALFESGESVMNAAGMAGLPAPAPDHADIAFVAGGNEGSRYQIRTYFIPHEAHGGELERTSIVTLGDSIAFGYGLADAAEQPSASAFPNLIGNGQEYAVVTYAESGMPTEAMLDVVENPSVKQSLRAADVVVLNIGSNDLLQPGKELALKVADDPNYALTDADTKQLDDAVAAFPDKLNEVAEAVRALTDAPIVLLNYYNPFAAGSPLTAKLHALVEPYIRQMNEAAAAVAAESGLRVKLVDVYAAFDGKQMTYVRLLQRDVHPTSRGQQAIADAVETAIGQVR